MTTQNRERGWLKPIFYYKFRELLTHTMFRYGLACPVYCCMPDHIHLLWIGLLPESDQRNAVKYLRRQINPVLEKLGTQLQRQPHDHVLRDDERQVESFESIAEYIMRNPERAGLVAQDRFRDYKFTGCLIPGTDALAGGLLAAAVANGFISQDGRPDSRAFHPGYRTLTTIIIAD